MDIKDLSMNELQELKSKIDREFEIRKRNEQKEAILELITAINKYSTICGDIPFVDEDGNSGVLDVEETLTDDKTSLKLSIYWRY